MSENVRAYPEIGGLGVISKSLLLTEHWYTGTYISYDTGKVLCQPLMSDTSFNVFMKENNDSVWI